MKASQFIDDVQSMVARYGDLEIVMEDDSSPIVEYSEDGDEPVLVIG